MKPILILIEGVDELRPVVAGLRAAPVTGVPRTFQTPPGAVTGAIVTVTGVGPDHSYGAAAAAIDRFDPALVVSAGTCGALTGLMGCSDWLVTGTVRALGTDSSGGRSLIETLESPAVATIERLVKALGAAPRCHGGRLLTVSKSPVIDAGEKEELAKSHDAVAVDMESAGIARAAAERHRPWLIARVVVDTPALPLPELGAMNVETGRPSLARIARYVLRHPVRGPKTLYGLWRLVQDYADHLVRVVPSIEGGPRMIPVISCPFTNASSTLPAAVGSLLQILGSA